MLDDPRWADVSNKQRPSAVALWSTAAGWCLRWKTGGHVPFRQPERMGWSEADAKALVVAGLWAEEQTGYRYILRDVTERDGDASTVTRVTSPSRSAANARASRYRARKRDGDASSDVTSDVTGRDAGRDGDGLGGVTRHGRGEGGSLSSPSDSPSFSPLSSPPGSERDQLADCNARDARDGAERDAPPNPSRFRYELEELVRGEFFARGATPQKAPASQWRDGCQTVADALQLGAYPDARAAMRAFAAALVDACAGGKPLGLALLQTPLGGALKPPAPAGRQLSELAQRAMARGGA